jgi:Zn-dependent peptidase ImmA (M78 family)
MDPRTKSAILDRAVALRQAEGHIDVIKLAKTYGIEVYPENKEVGDDFNACIVHDKELNKYKILVNQNQPLERQRFSIAHELAHYILHPDKLAEVGRLNRGPGDNINKEEEEKADSLAAEILMPVIYVDEYTSSQRIDKNTPITKSAVLNMAEYFKVSRTVVAIRLRNLKYFVPFYSFT